MIYNWNLIGHDTTLRLLEQDVSSGNLAHAYLFVGPSQLGKFTVARQMANILQCENNFCHTCSVCTQIKKGVHADTIVAANDGESVGIDFVKDLIARINMTTQSRYTVVLIEQIERVTIPATNTLLKTLEEPPDNVIFIMTTENARLILPTILSRVRMINFDLCSEEELMCRLKERFKDVALPALEQASLLALGKPGKAINFLEDRANLDYYQSLYNEVCALLVEENVQRKFQYVETILETPYMAEDFLDILEHVLRSRLLKLQAGENIEKTLNRDKILSLIKETQTTRGNFSGNINVRLNLENLLLAI